jgi:hypothetical protein
MMVRTELDNVKPNKDLCGVTFGSGIAISRGILEKPTNVLEELKRWLKEQKLEKKTEE